MKTLLCGCWHGEFLPPSVPLLQVGPNFRRKRFQPRLCADGNGALWGTLKNLNASVNMAMSLVSILFMIIFQLTVGQTMDVIAIDITKDRGDHVM